MNWLSYVEKQNAKLHVLPPGWDSRDDVAIQLGCKPDQVREQLRPSIDAKDVEVRVFRVWDRELKRTNNVTAYRKREKEEPKAAPRGDVRGFSLVDARRLKREGKSYASIGQVFGLSAEAVRKRLSRA